MLPSGTIRFTEELLTVPDTTTDPTAAPELPAPTQFSVAHWVAEPIAAANGPMGTIECVAVTLPPAMQELLPSLCIYLATRLSKRAPYPVFIQGIGDGTLNVTFPCTHRSGDFTKVIKLLTYHLDAFSTREELGRLALVREGFELFSLEFLFAQNHLTVLFGGAGHKDRLGDDFLGFLDGGLLIGELVEETPDALQFYMGHDNYAVSRATLAQLALLGYIGRHVVEVYGDTYGPVALVDPQLTHPELTTYEDMLLLAAVLAGVSD